MALTTAARVNSGSKSSYSLHRREYRENYKGVVIRAFA